MSTAVGSADRARAGPGTFETDRGDRMESLGRGLTATLFLLVFVAACGEEGADRAVGPELGPDELRSLSGDGQRAAVGDSLPDPFFVEAVREAGVVHGESVAWSVVDSAGPGAVLTSTATTTDEAGRASSRLVLGPRAGDYRVAAVLESIDDTVVFVATAEVPEPSDVDPEAGDDQSGDVGSPVSDSLVVEVKDQFGEPFAGAEVTFEVTRGAAAGASVDPDTASTDSRGRAAAALALGSKNGTYRVAAVAGPDSALFSARASGGTEALLSVDSIRPTTVRAGGTASVFGTGFSAAPDDNVVEVDGRRSDVMSATEVRLDVEVPVFTDECLPRRHVDVGVSTFGDTAPPVSVELTPSISPVNLPVGADTLVTGAEDVGCVLLPAASAGGAEYEVMATATPDALGFQTMSLFVNGSEAGSALRSTSGGRIEARAGGPMDGADPPDWRRKQYEWDRRLRRMGRDQLAEIRARSRRAPRMSQTVGDPTADVEVGDLAQFNVSCTRQPEVVAEVQSVSEAAIVYEDTAMDIRDVGFRVARYDSIAARFDTLLYPAATDYFGSPADIDRNGRVIMLFTPAVNRLVTSYDGGFIVGFFCNRDLSGSNEAEMFYLVSPDPAGEFTPDSGDRLSGDFVRSVIEGTVVHEFQHLINAQIGGGSDPSTPSSGGAQATWLNEGLSHLAEEVGGHAATGLGPGQELTAADLTADSDALGQFYQANFGNLESYLERPEAGTGVLSSEANLRTRGAAWSFVRYLLDRFASPGSEGVLTRALVQTPTEDARDAVEDAVESVSGRSVDFEDVLSDWATMFAVEDRADLGASPRPELELESYRLRDVYGSFALGTGSSYPLTPVPVGLTDVSAVDAELFTGTARYVRLVSSEESVGTGVRLADTDGDRLNASLSPRLMIVRTK